MRDFILIMPEIFLALTLAFVVFSEVTYHGEQVRLVTATAAMGLAAAFIQTILTYQNGPTQIFHNTLSVDAFSLFFKLLFIVLALLAIVGSSHTREIPQERQAEYCALVLASTLAMSLAASTTDLLLAFLALQSINILGYFLAGYGKRSVLSIEAGVKYLAFSSVAGALLLYGFAILFASTHTLNIYETHQFLMSSPLTRQVSLVIFMLVFLAFCFQVGAFPMYLWAPDVLEGAPTPAAAFMAVGYRMAGFALIVRFLISMFTQPAEAAGQWKVLGDLDWAPIMAVISGMTMIIGALLAFRQKGAKRLVACLVIAQTGYLLMGVLVLDQVGLASLLYNLVIELFALIGVFYILAVFQEEIRSDRLSDLNGMLARAVPESICLVLFLACLVGIPPTPGFIGKFTLVGVAVRHGWLALAAVAILSMTLSTAAIARLAYHLIGDFRTSARFGGAIVAGRAPLLLTSQRKVFLFVLIVPMVLVGVFADTVLGWAGKSLGFILW